VTEKRPFFHPASGVAILAIDWLFFGLEWELGPVSTVAASVAAAVSCYAVVRRIQTRWGGDENRHAVVKALIGATAAGVPFAIGGTVVGGAILALSGLRSAIRLGGRTPPVPPA
jgi:membrane protein implicated in regulation of membrane protease activity